MKYKYAIGDIVRVETGRFAIDTGVVVDKFETAPRKPRYMIYFQDDGILDYEEDQIKGYAESFYEKYCRVYPNHTLRPDGSPDIAPVQLDRSVIATWDVLGFKKPITNMDKLKEVFGEYSHIPINQIREYEKWSEDEYGNRYESWLDSLYKEDSNE